MESTPKNYLRSIITLGSSFLVLYIAISVCSFLSSEVMEQLDYGKLGFFLVSFYHFTFSLGCFVVPKLVKRYSARRVIPFGSAISFIFIGSYLIPIICNEKNDGFCNKIFVSSLLILAAFVGGIGLAMVWVSEKIYVRECSSNVTVNRNQGLFFSIFSANVVVGNILGMSLLQSEELRVGLYVIMTIVVLIAMGIQFCLPIPSKNQEKSDSPEKIDESSSFPIIQKNYLLFIFYILIDLLIIN